MRLATSALLSAAVPLVPLDGRVTQELPSVPYDGLVAQYLFAGDAADSGPGACHGRVEGPTLTEDRFGDPDSAYAFDGIDDQIVIDPPPGLSREGLTVSVWARFDLAQVGPTWKEEGAEWHHPIIGEDDGIAIRVFQLHLTDGKICWHRLFWYTSEWCNWQVEADRWYHIAAVWDGESRTHSLYVDAVMEHEGEGRLNVCRDQPIHIGSKGELGKQTVFFAGAIDDVRLYNRALSADEVLALYAEGGWTGEDE